MGSDQPQWWQWGPVEQKPSGYRAKTFAKEASNVAMSFLTIRIV